MIYYAIRHKSTGKYLPEVKNTGYTWTEPTAPETGKVRLFTEERYAKSALTAWLTGGLKAKYDYLCGDFEGLEAVNKPHRKAEDMEIVRFRLVEDNE